LLSVFEMVRRLAGENWLPNRSMIHPTNCIVTEPPFSPSVSQLDTALDLVNIVDMAYMPLFEAGEDSSGGYGLRLDP
jgi:hypothetical protein